jgi:tetratricopeptide (TPR) repeat protein
MTLFFILLLLPPGLLQEVAGAGYHSPAFSRYLEAARLYQAGDIDRADAIFREVLEEFRVGMPATADLFAATLHNLGVSARRHGDPQLSLQLLDESLAVRRTTMAPINLASTLSEIAATNRMLRRYHDAEAPIREAIALLEAQPFDTSALRAITYNTFGALHLDLQNPELALVWFERALKCARAADPPSPVSEASILTNMALTHFALGGRDESVARFREAIALEESRLGPRHPQLAVTLNSFSSVLKRLKRKDEAAAVSRRAGEITNSFTGTAVR